MTALVLICMMMPIGIAAAEKTGTVFGGWLILRSTPSFSGTIKSSYPTGTKVTITGQDNYDATDELPTEGALAGSYQITNVKLYELPSTGGPGDYLFTIIGISISFAIVLLKLRELKEERAA